jgi:hypothetical protein
MPEKVWSVSEKRAIQKSIFLIVTIDMQCRRSRHPHSLGSNNIGDAGAQHLAEAFARNTTLQKL